MRASGTVGLLHSRSAGRILILALLLLLPVSLMAAVTFGTMRLPLSDVYGVLYYKLLHTLFDVPVPAEWAAGSALHDVVWLIRLPRLVLGAAVGAALAVCGVVMQAIVKNPLADPYVLGVSSGASLGATVATLFGVGAVLGARSVGAVAFAGALLVSFAVLFLANLGGRATAVKLLLSGSALSAVCGAFSNFAIYLRNDDHAPAQIIRWTMGGLGAANWQDNAVFTAAVLAGSLFFLTQSRALNLMLLGDESAVTLGMDLHGRRIVYLLVTSLLIGLAVYNAGIIGFVGLVVPHVTRLLLGTDHRRLVPASALAGSIFLVWADVACRTVLPGNEVPIGILTSMLGAPVFLYLMVRYRYGFGGGGG
ncbi:FecCD family ABC transporter permease [Subdoligranulum variabile]|uniref:Iron chelate uptake ABC transporter, FeCT family, permease protein n=1 Tax=Subdoligranulum variabile DSM 15176 TaxID=411471 RepID=D1PMD4_9FIRM|nr:iron ABC transporter permease [Subdoligranulum variabile]EFB75719.1 iron chelate uptake ABC transporter, FeCT family, permease protein [Subdoligranulum variabile DSM 15176]UWP68419.1 iron ABC transporter permease [Subdoligranulum variabile]